MRSVQTLGIAVADAVGITATAGGFRQPALDHIFGGPEESLKQPFSPTHHLIVRYADPGHGVKRKLHWLSKMFWSADWYDQAEMCCPAA